MVLKSLEMQGFKSFPDKTVLNFGKGITAVVGPNGSGKSNISDAVRWVLGEQRTKSLRGAKMEDVIFGGTSTRRAVGFAQVTLTLDNSDKTFADKNELVSVSRRYYRSGESEYKIDGELVRRKDIKELFMDTGLGADGYSMVGQGKIDSIISAKTEDRREIFEEAAGISKFRSKRTDAQRKLEQAQENLVRLLDILGELEGRVEPLRIQSEKAGKFLEYSEEKKELEIGLWLYKINRFTQDLREQERKIDAAKISYDTADKELGEIVAEIESVIEASQKISVEIDEIRRGASAYEEEALRCDGEMQVLQNDILHNNSTVERILKDMENASGESNILDSRIDEKNALIEEKQLFIKEKRARAEQLGKKIENIEKENNSSSLQSTELTVNISKQNLILSEQRLKESQAKTSCEEILERSGTLESAVAKSTEVLASIERQKKESEENIAFLSERLSEFSNSADGCRMRVHQREEKLVSIKNDVDRLSVEHDKKRQRAKMLNDLEKNMEGYTGAVKLVMKQAKSNALNGILGPVSQLISVDNKYAAAIETALGMAMQNIVTESQADAKRAIYFLKQNKAGRATFLPIDAIKGRHLAEKGLDDCIGYVDVAQNLVSCDVRYSEIISSLLGKTVVCEDMDSAIGMSKRFSYRFRIVTLDGQIINAGGSMTGGSRASNAGFLSRGTEIEKLEKEAADIFSRLEEQRGALKKVNEELARAKADFHGAQADLANAAEEKIRAEGEDRLLSEQLSNGRKNLSSIENERENAGGRLELFKAAGENAAKAAAKAEGEIKALQLKLDDITGSSKELVRQMEETTSLLSQINIEIMTAVNDEENARSAINELEQRRLSHSDRLTTIQSEIDHINTHSDEIKKKIEQIKLKSDALREKSKSSKSDIEKLLEKRGECEKRSGDLRISERAKTGGREKLSTELGRLEERKNAMEKEYEDTLNKLYDEYQLTRAQAAESGKKIDDTAKATRRLNELKGQIRALGSVNVAAIEEYKEVSQRYAFLKEQIEDIEKSRKELSKIIEELTRSMGEKFKVKFDKISEEFKVCFADFFGGGSGEIVLEDESNILECAIEIKIQPPGKSVQNITLFSGGEKSLAALALLFAILKVTPSPFCIYDEVEAALDDVNVERFAKYMRRMTGKTQFISITHRRGTMEEADVLYGVTMQEKGVSKLLELQTTELAEKLGIK